MASNSYYGGYYGPGYAYEPGYAYGPGYAYYGGPSYYGAYAYEPVPHYGYRYGGRYSPQSSGSSISDR